MQLNKILGEERREFILDWLKNSHHPVIGRMIAERTNVSRQVIVGDISLLKAKGAPIIATSQGYLYQHHQLNGTTQCFERLIVAKHKPIDVQNELFMIVDHGVTVKDVIIEHPVYGDLTASIMVSNRQEVKEFIHKINRTKASYLSELTDGVHMHTLVADSKEKLESAFKELQAAKFLLNEEE
ncbi:transcription repressor NadR [Bacillus carboniphilus]|uniref:Transcription repressor NadR n=1 Tax=Bacillus carboniphilus TaxID=86663 RepID=A0ABY9JY65_9BACI|nr:transcription repressor NadR [Bacillus carboniphilus]WLR44290.1 transcription repressor NadR [Bacillus carboniphilus]